MPRSLLCALNLLSLSPTAVACPAHCKHQSHTPPLHTYKRSHTQKRYCSLLRSCGMISFKTYNSLFFVLLLFVPAFLYYGLHSGRDGNGERAGVPSVTFSVAPSRARSPPFASTNTNSRCCSSAQNQQQHTTAHNIT